MPRSLRWMTLCGAGFARMAFRGAESARMVFRAARFAKTHTASETAAAARSRTHRAPSGAPGPAGRASRAEDSLARAYVGQAILCPGATLRPDHPSLPTVEAPLPHRKATGTPLMSCRCVWGRHWDTPNVFPIRTRFSRTNGEGPAPCRRAAVARCSAWRPD